jgi:hypothetical protein
MEDMRKAWKPVGGVGSQDEAGGGDADEMHGLLDGLLIRFDFFIYFLFVFFFIKRAEEKDTMDGVKLKNESRAARRPVRVLLDAQKKKTIAGLHRPCYTASPSPPRTEQAVPLSLESQPWSTRRAWLRLTTAKPKPQTTVCI